MKLTQKTVDALVVLVTGAALEKCRRAWENMAFVQEILKAAQ